MPRILTGVPVVCSAKPTERRKPGCTPVSHATSGLGVPPGGTAGCAHAWHGIANAMQVATRVHGFMHAAPGDEGESRKTPMTDATAIRRHSGRGRAPIGRSEEHTSELQSLMRISYAVFCLKKKK